MRFLWKPAELSLHLPLGNLFDSDRIIGGLLLRKNAVFGGFDPGSSQGCLLIGTGHSNTIYWISLILLS